jgi:CheY-like chemotaxis protein
LSLDQETVLVIDNDPVAVEWLTRKLTREGLRVISAPGGEEGLRLARQQRPSTIFLDVVMPVLDGWAVLAALKADPRLAAIPVVMVTMLDERKKGLALGVADYLIKPVDRVRLATLLDQLRRRKPQTNSVLVVEDDTMCREMLVRALRKQGWQVHEAADGQEALKCVAETPPTLILLDLMLPVLDGQMLVRELAKVPAYRAIPIVILTARDLSQDERRSLGTAVRKVLQKGSCNREALLRELSEFQEAALPL